MLGVTLFVHLPIFLQSYVSCSGCKMKTQESSKGRNVSPSGKPEGALLRIQAPCGLAKPEQGVKGSKENTVLSLITPITFLYFFG